MKNNSITSIRQLSNKIIDNFNFVVFMTIIAGSLIGCLFALVDIVYMSYDTINATTNMSDQTAINRLNTYEISLQNSNYKVVPTGKVNPFAE